MKQQISLFVTVYLRIQNSHLLYRQLRKKKYLITFLPQIAPLAAANSPSRPRSLCRVWSFAGRTRWDQKILKYARSGLTQHKNPCHSTTEPSPELQHVYSNTGQN